MLDGDTKAIRIAVVGHTNVGKTSLLRTLTRNASFGDVASSPGTTRAVERARLQVGDSALLFFDTPGLEDSAGLLSHLKAAVDSGIHDWVEAIAGLGSGSQSVRFEQEAKALRQVLQSDILFYVIDARDTVRAKHRDELEILMRCARPIVAVLNFVAQSKAGEVSWREALARTNIHAIARFDTVAYDESGETALYEKARTLSDANADVFRQRLDDIRSGRRAALDAGVGRIAGMVKELGALTMSFAADESGDKERQSVAIKTAALKAEQDCTSDLLTLFRFDQGDYLPKELSIEDGEWRDDPFDPDVLARFGLNLGKAAATGAAVGLGVDILVGGMTLGAAAATGALVGTGFDALRRYGRDIQDRIRGRGALKIQLNSLALMTARQLSLLKALHGRGHGAQGQIITGDVKKETEAFFPLLKASLTGQFDEKAQKALAEKLKALV